MRATITLEVDTTAPLAVLQDVLTYGTEEKRFEGGNGRVYRVTIRAVEASRARRGTEREKRAV